MRGLNAFGVQNVRDLRLRGGLALPWTRVAVSSAAAFALLLSSRGAYATDCSGIYSTCINDDTLFPHAGASRFLGFGGTETVAAGQVAFGVVTTYLSRPIVLHVPSPGPGGTDFYAIDDQVNGNFLWAYGVTDRLELDIALPVTFGQGGTGVAPLTGGNGINDTAMRDLRVGLAYAIVPRPRVTPDLPADSVLARRSRWAVTARLEASAPTGDRDQFAGERSAVWIPTVTADWRYGRIFAGGEIGARLRPVTQILGARVGSQGIVALGAGYDVLRDELLSFIAEARALPTFAEQHDAVFQPDTGGTVTTPNGKALIPAEWSLSARTAPIAGGDLAFQLGGGGGIPLQSDAAATVPRFRFTASIRYAPMMRDTDGDGVLDKDDKCPRDPGPVLPGQPADGCPHVAPPTPPGAAPVAPLKLSGARDVCTTDPEIVDGFFDDDGCPDEDSDKDGVPNRYDKCPLVPEDYAGLSEGCPEKK